MVQKCISHIIYLRVYLMETQSTESCLQIYHPLVIMRDWNDVASDIHGCISRSDKSFWSERSTCQALMANNYFQGFWCPLHTGFLDGAQATWGCIIIWGVKFFFLLLFCCIFFCFIFESRAEEKHLMDLVLECVTEYTRRKSWLQEKVCHVVQVYFPVISVKKRI